VAEVAGGGERERDAAQSDASTAVPRQLAPEVHAGKRRTRDAPTGSNTCTSVCDPVDMAGGMDRRPHRVASLAERTRGATVGPGSASAAAAPSPPHPAGVPAAAGPQRHCWVVDAVQHDARAPGLLVEWRQLAGAWQGRVAYVVVVDGEATLVEAWVPATQLERAERT
jgi:hypothetical protein